VRASIYLVLATLFWSGNLAVGQAAVNTLTPLELTFWRWALAALPLVALTHFVERPDWRAVLGRWRVLLLLSVLGMCCYTLLLYTALQHTSALYASMITAANPALIVVMAIFILGEKPGALGWLGIALGLTGVLLVLTRGELGRVFSLTFNVGELLMLGAIAVWGFYTIISRWLELPAIAATAVQVVMATVLLAPAAAAAGARFPSTAAEGWSIAYIAAFPSLGAYLCWNLALKTTPPGTAGNYLNLIVVFTAAITVLTGIPVTLTQAIGGLLVITGVVLASRPGRSAGVTAA
jgi:drug/metabolite transporter (DMT)-like permease